MKELEVDRKRPSRTGGEGLFVRPPQPDETSTDYSGPGTDQRTIEPNRGTGGVVQDRTKDRGYRGAEDDVSLSASVSPSKSLNPFLFPVCLRGSYRHPRDEPFPTGTGRTGAPSPSPGRNALPRPVPFERTVRSFFLLFPLPTVPYGSRRGENWV